MKFTQRLYTKVISILAVIGFLLLLVPFEIHSQSTDICSQEEDGTRLSYFQDCQHFVVCLDRAVAKVGQCPRGLHFNRELGECDYQWRADCSDLSVDDSSDACSCSCCADECEADDLFEVTTPCPPNAETLTPNDEESTETSTIDDTTNSDETLITDDFDTTIKTTTSSPSVSVPSYCSDQCTSCINEPDGAMVPVEGVCTNYIQCTHGCCQEFICPSGLYFNFDINECDYFWNVECTPDDTGDVTGEIAGPSGTTCSDQGVCAKQRDGVMFANPDTNGYFVCQCQCPIAMPCDANTKFNETAQVCDWDRSADSTNSVICPDGLVYNATSDQCDYAEDYVPKVQCNNNSTVCQGQAEGVLFPVEGACNKFYKCNYECAVEQVCPNNLIYNSDGEYCDYPQNVKCEWEYTPPSGPNAGPSGTSCESNGRCLGAQEGTLLPSLTNCTNYVVCQCECEVEMGCSSGLHWDQTLQTCNYASEAGCSL